MGWRTSVQRRRVFFPAIDNTDSDWRHVGLREAIFVEKLLFIFKWLKGKQTTRLQPLQLFFSSHYNEGIFDVSLAFLC